MNKNLNALDYYQNPNIIKAINFNLKHIHNESDREDCRQEVFADLYSFMPLDESEAIRLVNRVARKFKRDTERIQKNEGALNEY